MLWPLSINVPRGGQHLAHLTVYLVALGVGYRDGPADCVRHIDKGAELTKKQGKRLTASTIATSKSKARIAGKALAKVTQPCSKPLDVVRLPSVNVDKPGRSGFLIGKLLFNPVPPAARI